MKNKRLENFIAIIIGLVVLCICLLNHPNEIKNVWDVGTATQGIVIRTKDLVQEDNATHGKYYPVKVRFTVDSNALESREELRIDAAVFDTLDTDDHDGQVTVDVRYKENRFLGIPLGAYTFAFYGQLLDDGTVIGK